MRRILVAFLLLLIAGHDAQAYIGPPIFAQPALSGGGGGMYFTGAPRQKAYDCTVCHVGGAHTIGANVTIVPDDGSAPTPGVYTAGKSYAITLALTGEHLGLGAARNVNTFLAEIDDDRDAAIAGFGGFDSSVTTVDGGKVVAAAGQEAQTTWTFHFTAPAAGAGPITLYGSLVDGNGGDGTAAFPSDPLGDDVATITLRLCEGVSGCAPRLPRADVPSPAAGCMIGGAGRTSRGGVWIMGVLSIGWLVARRRVALAAWLLGMSGCHDPVLPAECPNRICGDAGLGIPTFDAPPMMDCNGEAWECGAWASSPSGSNNGVRTCTDKNMRGTTLCKPATTATLPALDLEAYKCNVEPILDHGCGMLGCHGVEKGHSFRMYARGRLRNDETVPQVPTCPGGPVNLAMMGSGTVMCVGWSKHTDAEWQKNFDSARSFMIGVASPDDSELLAEPLAGTYYAHTAVKLFASTTDPKYVAIRAWLAGGTLGGACNTGAN